MSWAGADVSFGGADWDADPHRVRGKIRRRADGKRWERAFRVCEGLESRRGDGGREKGEVAADPRRSALHSTPRDPRRPRRPGSHVHFSARVDSELNEAGVRDYFASNRVNHAGQRPGPSRDPKPGEP